MSGSCGTAPERTRGASLLVAFCYMGRLTVGGVIVQGCNHEVVAVLERFLSHATQLEDSPAPGCDAGVGDGEVRKPPEGNDPPGRRHAEGGGEQVREAYHQPVKFRDTGYLSLVDIVVPSLL